MCVKEYFLYKYLLHYRKMPKMMCVECDVQIPRFRLFYFNSMEWEINLNDTAMAFATKYSLLLITVGHLL